MRILYFDIDGVLLSYDSIQRPLLADGALQSRLKQLGFSKLVCLSGWSDLVNVEILRKSQESQKISIYSQLASIFPDKDWFLSLLELAYDTDHRCKHINTEEDWYYMDDWADKFFSDQFGNSFYMREVNRRILLVNPHGDGSDILLWLDTTVKEIVQHL